MYVYKWHLFCFSNFASQCFFFASWTSENKIQRKSLRSWSNAWVTIVKIFSLFWAIQRKRWKPRQIKGSGNIFQTPCKLLWIILIRQGLLDTLHLLYLPRGDVVDVTGKMWILVRYNCKKILYKSKEKKFELCKSTRRMHLVTIFWWFSGWCYRENVNFGLV